MAVGVVDLLEAVEVDHGDGAGGVAPLRAEDLNLELVLDAAVVEQAGEAVLLHVGAQDAGPVGACCDGGGDALDREVAAEEVVGTDADGCRLAHLVHLVGEEEDGDADELVVLAQHGGELHAGAVAVAGLQYDHLGLELGDGVEELRRLVDKRDQHVELAKAERDLARAGADLADEHDPAGSLGAVEGEVVDLVEQHGEVDRLGEEGRATCADRLEPRIHVGTGRDGDDMRGPDPLLPHHAEDLHGDRAVRLGGRAHDE